MFPGESWSVKFIGTKGWKKHREQRARTQERPIKIKYRNIGLQFLASGLSISWNPVDFMKSSRFHVKSTQNLIKANVSTKTIQFDEYRRGAMNQEFMKSWVIAPSLHPPNWRVFVETSDFIRFWVDFTWNLPDFKNMSFCVMIKYRSFFRKTKQMKSAVGLFTSLLILILSVVYVCGLILV